MTRARLRPPLNAPSTRCSICAAAVRGFSPTAMPRMSVAFIARSACPDRGRAVECTRPVVRVTMALSASSPARSKVLAMWSVPPACGGYWEPASRRDQSAASAVMRGSAWATVTGRSRERSRSAARVSSSARCARRARDTFARDGQAPSLLASIRSSMAACHSVAISFQAVAQARMIRSEAASTRPLTAIRMPSRSLQCLAGDGHGQSCGTSPSRTASCWDVAAARSAG